MSVLFSALEVRVSFVASQESDGAASSSSSTNSSRNPIGTVANTCGMLLGPLCSYAHSTFTSNVENVVLSLAQADPDFMTQDTSDVCAVMVWSRTFG